MFCQRCGTKNSAGDAFCSGCGAPLQAPAAAGVFCQQCGAPAGAGQQFCQQCGAPLAVSGTPPGAVAPAYAPSAQPAQMLPGAQRRGVGARTIVIVIAALVVAYVVNIFLSRAMMRGSLSYLGESMGYGGAVIVFGAFQYVVAGVIIIWALRRFGR